MSSLIVRGHEWIFSLATLNEISMLAPRRIVYVRLVAIFLDWGKARILLERLLDRLRSD